jgi:hypothetical protein
MTEHKPASEAVLIPAPGEEALVPARSEEASIPSPREEGSVLFPGEEGFIPVPGGRVWYGVYGKERRGVPLLVLHGGPGFLSLPHEVADLADERPGHLL